MENTQDNTASQNPTPADDTAAAQTIQQTGAPDGTSSPDTVDANETGALLAEAQARALADQVNLTRARGV